MERRVFRGQSGIDVSEGFVGDLLAQPSVGYRDRARSLGSRCSRSISRVW